MDIFELLKLFSILFVFFWLFVFPFLLPQTISNWQLFCAYIVAIVIPLILLYIIKSNDPLCNLEVESSSDLAIASGMCQGVVLLLKPIVYSTIGGIVTKTILFYLDYKGYKFSKKLVTSSIFTGSLTICYYAIIG